MKKPSLLVLAAGLGSRYKGQKQTDALGDNQETLLEFALYDALQKGLKKVVFIINDQFPKAYKNHLEKNLTKKGCQVFFIEQTLDKFIPQEFKAKVSDRRKPLGTGHAVYCAKGVIAEPFITINADDFYGRDSLSKAFDMVASGTLQEDRYGMVAFELINTLSKNGTVSRGVCQTKDGYLQSVEEYTSIAQVDGVLSGKNDETQQERTLDLKTLVSMNFWVLAPSFFDFAKRDLTVFLRANEDLSQKEFYLPAVVDKAIQRGEVRVKVEPTHEKWFGLTYADDKATAMQEIERLKAKGSYPAKLWE